MFIEVPKFIKRIFPDLIWSFVSEQQKKEVFLTFDDGPTPEITEWILNTLSNYNAKATFFCLGKNVEMYPELAKKIVDEGHAIANHTYSHQKGFGMSVERYVQDIDLADEYIHSPLYRPPYGHITPSQARRLSERYKIIMWNVLSRDYSSVVTPEKCAERVVKNTRLGSIVVFHDSVKAYKNMSYALPILLEHLTKNGIECKKIEL
ncbi:MAG: polysaccharide deacetylase family protein [Rikenellaceae bacterium]